MHAPVASTWTMGQRWRLLALLCLVGAFNFIDRQIITVLIVPIQADFGASDTQLGLLTGLLFAGSYALASIPLATLSDRYQRKYVLAGCLSVWSMMTALGGAATSFVQLAMTRVGVAVAEAGAVPASHSMISDIFPVRQRATAIAVFSAVQSLGIGAGVFLGGMMVGSLGWRLTLVLVGIPGLVLALILVASREPRRGMSEEVRAPQQAAGGPLAAIGLLMRVPGYPWLCLLMASVGFSGFGILSWGPSFLHRWHGLTLEAVGAAFGGAVALGLIIGNLVAGPLADRWGRRGLENYALVAALGVALAIVPGLFFIFSPGPELALAGLFFFQIFLTFHLPAAYALGQTLAPPNNRAMASVLLGLASSGLGGGLAPLTIGWLSDLLGPSSGAQSLRDALLATILAALVAIVAAMIAYAKLRQARKTTMGEIR